MLTNHLGHYCARKNPKPEHISPTLLPISLLFRALLSEVFSNLPPALGQSSRICRIILGDVGVKRFHQFLYGRKFTLVTDHKPLQAILGPKSAVPTLAAARMQRWALLLSAYDYDLMCCKSGEHANADGLSRLRCQESRVALEAEVYTIGALRENFPVMAVDIAGEFR